MSDEFRKLCGELAGDRRDQRLLESQRAAERLAKDLLAKAAEVDLLEATLTLQRERMRQARQLARCQWIVAAAAGGYAWNARDMGSTLVFFLSLLTAAAGGFLFLRIRPRRIGEIVR